MVHAFAREFRAGMNGDDGVKVLDLLAAFWHGTHFFDRPLLR